MKKSMILIIIIFLSYWSVAPLFQAGFFPIHDDTQVVRVHQMHKSLSAGMFPVRWVSDLGYGYGYPIFNFYAPLAYYIGAVFMFLGFSALAATKIMIGIGVILAGISMYFLAREFWGEKAAIVSALLYVYAPYHALNIYVRGAIAELWAYGIVPFVFFAIYKLYLKIQNSLNLELKSKVKSHKQDLLIKANNDIWKYVGLTAISYCAVILSHNLTAMMITPFILVFAAFLYVKLRILSVVHKPYYIFLGLIIGISLSAFYWLPVPIEMKYTNVLSVVGGGSDYRDHFVCIKQLWNSPWGFAGSASGCVDGFSLKIGKIHILLGLLSISSLYFLIGNDRNKLQMYLLFIFFLISSIFLTLNSSQFIWDSIPPMAFFQFPWRFLILVVLFLSFISGGFIWVLDKILSIFKFNQKYSYIIVGVIVFTIIFYDSKVFMTQNTINLTSNDYTNLQYIKWESSKISDEYMPSNFSKPINKHGIAEMRYISNEDIKIISYKEKSNLIDFKINVLNPTVLRLNLAYYPNWHVFINNNQAWFKYSSQGVMIDLEKGIQDVQIRYSQTSIQRLGNSISVISIIVLFVGIISQKRNKL